MQYEIIHDVHLTHAKIPDKQNSLLPAAATAHGTMDTTVEVCDDVVDDIGGRRENAVGWGAPATEAATRMTHTQLTWKDLLGGTTNERGSATKDSWRLLMLHEPAKEWCRTR